MNPGGQLVLEPHVRGWEDLVQGETWSSHMRVRLVLESRPKPDLVRITFSIPCVILKVIRTGSGVQD